MPQTAITHDFKVVVDGITLTCRLSAPPGTPTTHITEKIAQLERYVQNPDQIKFEFEAVTVLEDVTLTADKPSTGDRLYSIRLNINNAPMTDRSTLFNLAQTGKKVIVKIIQPDEKKAKKTAKVDKPKDEKEPKIDSTEPPAGAAEPEGDGRAPAESGKPGKPRGRKSFERV